MDYEEFRSMFGSDADAARACWAFFHVVKDDRDKILSELQLTKNRLRDAERKQQPHGPSPISRPNPF